MGKDVNDMQVGCDWIGDNLISVSLSGALNFFKLDNELEPTKVVKVDLLIMTVFLLLLTYFEYNLHCTSFYLTSSFLLSKNGFEAPPLSLPLRLNGYVSFSIQVKMKQIGMRNYFSKLMIQLSTQTRWL